MTNKTQKKYPDTCKTEMTFQECELAILRQAVDEGELTTKKKLANSDDVKNMIDIVEKFLQQTKCICYGGTAINNILPEESQFYNKEIEVPDYDFYSKTPLKHAKQLADFYLKEGYKDVEAKAGVHFGTYKVFVNFIPMADITLLHPSLFNAMKKESIIIKGIYYTPPNFLRMSMYLELSRPAGDISRWEKVLKRLTALNKHYPLKTRQCQEVSFQRPVESSIDSSEVYKIVKNFFIDQRVVFFGGFATFLYSKHMHNKQRKKANRIPDFDVLTEDVDKCTGTLKQVLTENGFENVKIVKHKAIGEIIPMHHEIIVNKETIAFVYSTIACHNYNEIEDSDTTIKVATIDTILSFYLAFLYADYKHFSYFRERFLCIAQYLFDVEEKNRLSQNGILKRFSMKCIGVQPTLESIRAEKTEMFEKLKNKKADDPLKEAWFLKYTPGKKKGGRKCKTRKRK